MFALYTKTFGGKFVKKFAQRFPWQHFQQKIQNNLPYYTTG